MQAALSSVDPERVLDGLNEAQRRAATAVRGPVAIAAGAGTGKTTTITRRIAYQVATGAIPARAILAVTFTQKAGGELKARLRSLGVEGVEARTFHSAALSQLSRLWQPSTGRPLPDVLDAKAPVIASLANSLPPPYKFMPRRDLAGEVEWAKNRMVAPGSYGEELERTGHQPPIPADLMLRVYEGYERRKERMGRLDFEDMLGLAVRLFDEHPTAAAEVRERFAAFTVDEYQDVNPLQQALLDRWLGGRDEVCVVGDDHQTIYGFTGASPQYLLSFPDRYPNAQVVVLEENHRSSPEVLAVANLLSPAIGGFTKRLVATKPSGPDPQAKIPSNEVAEVDMVVDEVRRLHAEGVPHHEMAVLYRINARSEPFEEAFAAAHIPYQVRDGAFLRRPGPRSAIARLRRAGAVDAPVADMVAQVTDGLGYAAGTEADSAEEATRQADLARLRALAEEHSAARPEDGVDAFLAELARRFSEESSGRGVNLLTYHRAKGLEFDAVFLPRLVEGELPFRSGRSVAPVDEERRLLYVGITRARKHLLLSWPRDVRGGRSRFVDEILGEARPEATAPPARQRRSPREPVPGAEGPVFEALKRWRLERSRADGVPAYVVFHDSTLAAIAGRKPRSRADLAGVPGVGPAKLERYANDLLAVLDGGDEG